MTNAMSNGMAMTNPNPKTKTKAMTETKTKTNTTTCCEKDRPCHTVEQVRCPLATNRGPAKLDCD